MARIEIDYAFCKLCGLCAYHCRRGALKSTEPENDKVIKRMEVNQEICNGCAICALTCPDAAIAVYR